MQSNISKIANELDKHHATKINVLDFQKVSADFDYFVIASCSNSRLAWSVVSYLEEMIANESMTIRKIEGNSQSRWILVDCYDVVIHLFVEEERDIVQLESLWCDIPRMKVSF